MDHETVTTTTTEAAADDAAPEARTLTLDIEHGCVRALLLHAATKDVRYYLNGVCVDTTGPTACMVATDGHRLLALPIMHISDGLPRGCYIIPRDALAKVKPRKVDRKHVAPIRITLTANGVTGTLPPRYMIEGDATVTGDCIDGRFPEWRRIVPRSPSGKPGQFNGAYLGDFHEAAKLIGGGNGVATLTHNGDAAALVRLPLEAVGVIMPMRADEPLKTAPDWIG